MKSLMLSFSGTGILDQFYVNNYLSAEAATN